MLEKTTDLIIEEMSSYVEDYLNHGWKFKRISRNGNGLVSVQFEKEDELN